MEAAGGEHEVVSAAACDDTGSRCRGELGGVGSEEGVAWEGVRRYFLGVEPSAVLLNSAGRRAAVSICTFVLVKQVNCVQMRAAVFSGR